MTHTDMCRCEFDVYCFYKSIVNDTLENLKYVTICCGEIWMENLLKKIRKLTKDKDRIIIGIDGPAAAGKSTLAYKLQEDFGGSVFHMDDYFLTDDLRTEERLGTPGGNVDYERMHKEIFLHLSEDAVDYKKYNCHTKRFEEETEVLKNVIIIEGVYSHRPEFKQYYDVTVFLEVDSEEQLRRLEKRNAKMVDRFINEWLPMENKYFDAFSVKERADYILK